MSPRRFHWYPHTLAVVKLPVDAPLPPLGALELFSLTRTPRELSLVVPEHAVPESAAHVSRGWRALAVIGPLDLTLVGIMSEVSGALAAAAVSLFAISTHDTDLVLVAEADVGRAQAALEATGWTLADP